MVFIVDAGCLKQRARGWAVLQINEFMPWRMGQSICGISGKLAHLYVQGRVHTHHAACSQRYVQPQNGTLIAPLCSVHMHPGMTAFTPFHHLGMHEQVPD
eukprot:1151860-Pelagomonas_calceolata.AAC.4